MFSTHAESGLPNVDSELVHVPASGRKSWLLSYFGILLLVSPVIGWSASSLSLSSSNVTTGSTTQLALSVAGDPVAGVQWNLTYPVADFTAINVTTGSAADSAGKAVYCHGSSGTLTCIATGLNTNNIASGVIATVALTAAPASGATPDSRVVSIGLDNAVSTSAAAAPLTITSTGTSSVTILKAKPSTITPSSISLRASQIQQFSTDASGTALVWTLTPNVGTISSTGLYTAPALISSATAVTVRAANAADPSVYVTARIDLNPVTVSLLPSTIQLRAGQTQQFTASVTDTGNSAVTWSLSPAAGSISASGLYTAPSTISTQQTVAVTATSVADPTKKATAAITLLPPAQSVTISVSPTQVSLFAGQSAQFAATVSGTTNTAVTWTRSPAVGTVSSGGLYTAPATVTSVQSVTITATSSADSTKIANAVVTLNPPVQPVAVSISPSTATLSSSQTAQFTATVTGTSNTSVVWSRTPAVGTVSTAGIYTAPASISTLQTVTVTATSVADSSKLASAVITLTPPASVNGPLVYLPLNESAGTVATDTSGNQRNGTLFNSPIWTAGKVGNGLALNGSSQYVGVPNIHVAGSGITVAAWVKFSSFPANEDQRIVSKASDPTEAGHYWMLGHTNSGSERLRFRLKTNGTTSTLVASSGDLSTNVWYHAAAVYDGSNMLLYLNGSLVGSLAKSGSIDTNSAVPVNIGRNPDSYGYFAGTVDEVKIFDRGLSPTEVAALMTESTTDTAPPVRSAGAPTGTLPVTTTSATLSLATDEDATCRYSTTAGVGYASMTGSFTTTGARTHSVSITGLTPGASRSYYVRCQDAKSNANPDDYLITFTVSKDSTSPTVPSGVTAAAASGSQIVVRWSASTDNMGVTGYKVYRNNAVVATLNALSYTDSGLTPATTYSYRVSAIDAAGNESGLSTAASVTTPAIPAPVISGVTSASITTASARIQWTTNEPTTGRVEYGTTTSYGSSVATGTTAGTSHSVDLTGLKAATAYQFRVVVTNASGVIATSPNTTFTTAQQPATTPGLVSRWSFNEGSGTVAADSVNGQNGTLTNGPLWTTGKLGQAIRLDGSNDYVALPTMDLTGSALTMSAWVMFTAFPANSDQRILSKSSGIAEQSHYWMLSQTKQGNAQRLRFRLRTGSSTTTLIASSGDLAANTWYHAVATYDGSTMKLYLNGTLVGSTAKTGTLATSTWVSVNIGRNPDGNNYLSGAIDEVQIFNRALTQAEIQQDMARTQ
jgi:hypothetical protein